jgi:undecaprenyl phosphate N,N'-diacetylbacillosamine 1-phosphate transferase
MYQLYMKRLLDFVLSLGTFIVVSPILFMLALLVRLKLGSPVFFKQKRPGLNEKLFMLYKFRTMTDERDANGNLLTDERRMTRFGTFLRSTSLDELPSLINIIKGEMSIVGPRPLLVQYLPLYNEHQRMRHTVRPGLTGYAQVNGRNRISWEERFDLDIEYVRNITLLFDCKIILKTLVKVFKREGVCSENAVTMEAFTKQTKNASDKDGLHM